MPTRSRLRPSIIVYKVGEDITREHYDHTLVNLARWFEHRSDIKEPLATAKKVLDRVLQGKKVSDGTAWQRAATSTISARLKMAANFDFENQVGIESALKRSKPRTGTVRDAQVVKRGREMKEKARKDAGYGAEYIDLEKLGYGDSPLTFFTTAENNRRAILHEGYTKQFPQLDNIAAQGKLDLLLDLMILVERIRFRNADTRKNAVKSSESEMQQLTKQVVELERALGIHPEQLAKLQKAAEGGSVGEAVKRMYEMGGHEEMRELATVEELILLYQAYQQPSPRSNTDGFQLNDVVLWGATQCRTCICPKCGQHNFAGFTISEIEAWLESQGNLTPRETPVDTLRATRVTGQQVSPVLDELEDDDDARA